MAVRWDVLREPMLFGGVVAGRDGGEETMLFGGASPLTEWDCKSGSGGLEKQKIFLFLFIIYDRLETGWRSVEIGYETGWRSAGGRLEIGWR